MTEDYPQNSLIQQQMIKNCIGKATAAIEDMQMKNQVRFSMMNEPFTVADLGAASGKNSIPIYKAVIETVRKINPELPIILYLNDLPECSFTEGFLSCQQELNTYGDVFVYAVGKSFYELLFPSKTIDLYLCFAAIHWLREVAHVGNAFFYFPTKENLETEASQKWIAQGHKDFTHFLHLRDIELKPHGAIIIATMSSQEDLRDDDKKWIQITEISNKALVNVLTKYSLKQYHTVLPILLRQKAQYLDVIKAQSTAFKLKSYNEYVLDVAFCKEYKEDHDEDKYVKRLTAWLRAFSHECLAGLMISAGADKEKVNKAMKEVYEEEFAKFKEEFLQNAAETFTQAVLVIEK